MNAVLLMIPLLFIRFGLLGMLGKEALSRAASFAPLEGGERAAYLFYQISNAVLLLGPLFFKIRTEPPRFYIGLAVYILGIAVLAVSTVAFARPSESGLNAEGIYRLSRNPMYVGYFLYYLGCAVLADSVLLLVTLLVFQVSAHWIILSEERWCIARFGDEYRRYMKRVRRYL